MGDWDPARYLRFSEERGRPCRDLLARLAELTPLSVLDWYCGSGLRPYPDALDEVGREPFLSALSVALAADYPVRENGTVLLPMPRLFVVAAGRRA